MSNETEKPLAGVLRAVNILDGPHEEDEGVCECTLCRTSANIIARESGLAKLVEVIMTTNPTMEVDERTGKTKAVRLTPEQWGDIVAAARRVREG